MHIFATFDHNTYLELALAQIEEHGVARDQILAVPIKRRKPSVRLFDTIHSSDGFSLFDLSMPLATAFAVIGASYGFVLTWGPIIWGVIGAASGIVVGTGISLLRFLKRHGHEKRLNQKNVTEVIVIVHCSVQYADKVKDTLHDSLAYGVGELKQDQNDEQIE